MVSKATAAISLFSYPKINLALDILGKSNSGYHEIRTVYHHLSAPADEIILEDDESGAVAVFCDNPKVPTDEKNTAFKAALLVKKYFGILRGVKIAIHKKIPIMSGLGGGTSNAVATLCGLAKLWGIKCCHHELVEGCGKSFMLRQAQHDNHCTLRRIADQIGMDCAFFFNSKLDLVRSGPTRPDLTSVSRSRRALAGGTALGTHFGEKITSLPALPPEIKFEIIETGVEISSRDAYSWIDLHRCGKNKEKTARLIKAIRKQDVKGILSNLHNDFEEFIFAKFPKLLKMKRGIESKKPGRVMLCGSGGALVRW